MKRSSSEKVATEGRRRLLYRLVSGFCLGWLFSGSLMAQTPNPGGIGITGNDETLRTVCPNASPGNIPSLAAASSANGFTYLWQDSVSGGSWQQAAGTANNATYSPGMLATTTFFRRLAIDQISLEQAATNVVRIAVEDNTDPQISPIDDLTLSTAPGNCSQSVSWTPPTVTDNCGAGGLTTSSSHNPGSIFFKGSTTVTYTATDASGNSSNMSFNIIIEDNELPQITNCPGGVSRSSEPGRCGATVFWTEPVVSDNCPGVVRSVSHVSGSFFPVGITTVTYTATDQEGQSVSCSFAVTITDDQPPQIACPEDLEVNTDEGICGATVNLGISATDNCTQATLTQLDGLADGSLFPIGPTDFRYEALDAESNRSECRFTLTVSDREMPQFNCPDDVEVFNDPGTVTAQVSFPAPTATDNCPGVTVTQVEGLASGSLFPIGLTENVFEIEDASGNRQLCRFGVRVRYRNEQPDFSATNPPDVLEDVGVVEILNWAAFRPTAGDIINANEAAQTVLRYEVTGVSNSSLFAMLPQINTEGHLRFEPNPNAFGSSQFTVRVQDDGGRENGGLDFSNRQSFTLNVLPVNDAPTLDPIADIEMNATATIEVDLSGISQGADTEPQSLTVTAIPTDLSIIDSVAVDFNELYGTATLRFSSIPNRTGSLAIAVTVKDDGGIANGGVDAVTETFDVEVKASEMLFLPELFTPNNDGENDRFRVRGHGIESIQFEIFDREGHRVYQTRDVAEATMQGWDGTAGGQMQPSGIYTWKISGTMVNDGALQVRSFIKNAGQVVLAR